MLQIQCHKLILHISLNSTHFSFLTVSHEYHSKSMFLKEWVATPNMLATYLKGVDVF
jgi:hypothetical protein